MQFFRYYLKVSPFACLFLLASSAIAIDSDSLSTGGLGLGFNNTGAAYQSDISAIQINPALLAQKRQYLVSGSYHWPSSGNEFYQAGVIDSQTSSYAAGLSYMGFLDDAKANIKRRVNLGFAQSMGKFSLGIGGQFMDAVGDNGKKVQSIALSGGALMEVSQGLKLGLSAENIANKKIKEFAPRTYRAGLSYSMGQSLSANVDYQSRVLTQSERVAGSTEDKEQMVFGSLAGIWGQYLRVFASYGREINAPEKREALSGGAGIENNQVSIYYMVAMPDMNKKELKHHAINLSLNVKM